MVALAAALPVLRVPLARPGLKAQRVRKESKGRKVILGHQDRRAIRVPRATREPPDPKENPARAA
jgi:hypothetical protein